MERALTKTEIKGFVKDEGNRGLLQTDNLALEAYKKKKYQLGRMNTMEDKLNTIETDLVDIKKLLEKIVNG